MHSYRLSRCWLLVGLLMCILLSHIKRCEGSLVFMSFGLSVSKGTRPRKRVTNEITSVTTVFDEFGSLPQVKYAYQAISHSRRVATFRRQNATVVAYTLPSGDGLQQSIGCKPLYMLEVPLESGPCHHLLLTGIAGDCRIVVRHMKQMVLNHTMEFDASPSGDYLAAKLGSLLQSHTSGGGRLLAAHCFLISTPHASIDDSTGTSITTEPASKGTIFEVSATGSVSQVQGGTAGGMHMQHARRLLEERYEAELSVNSSRALLFDVFNATSGTNDRDEEVSLQHNEHSGPSFHYVEIPDNP